MKEETLGRGNSIAIVIQSIAAEWQPNCTENPIAIFGRLQSSPISGRLDHFMFHLNFLYE